MQDPTNPVLPNTIWKECDLPLKHPLIFNVVITTQKVACAKYFETKKIGQFYGGLLEITNCCAGTKMSLNSDGSRIYLDYWQYLGMACDYCQNVCNQQCGLGK